MFCVYFVIHILHVYHTCAVAGFCSYMLLCLYGYSMFCVYFVIQILHVYHTCAVAGFLQLHVALYVSESLVLLCICNTHVVYFVLALVCIFSRWDLDICWCWE